MPRLGIAKEFLADYAGLQKPVRRAVDAAIEKFTQHTHAGLHLEKLTNPKDPRIRTIRINQFWRGVVLAPEKGEEYLLLTVLPHNDAYAYATSRLFTVNLALGVLEVRNQTALEEITPALHQAAQDNKPLLFSGVKDAELIRLGIDSQVLPLVRLLTTETHLEALAGLLPTPQYDALAGLAAGLSPEEVWEEVSQYLPGGQPPAQVDPEDIGTAVTRTPDRFVMVSGPQELAQILSHPFDTWRTFLHPAQREIAYRTSYVGPAMVTGGAGTGKTVTALHRAVFLAQRAVAPVPAGHSPVLLTTFTRYLAEALERQLPLLTEDPETLARVHVLNVDRLAYQVVSDAHGRRPTVVDPKVLRGLWEQAAATLDGAFSPIFLEREWEQVILAQSLSEPGEYVAARRAGRGTPLQPAQKLAVWEAIRQVTDRLRHLNQHTHLQLATKAARILTERATAPYQHVVVDEGQDLHPAQWRLLRAAARPAPDDLFIVADPHQRIYDNQVSLASLGINVRGRTRRLKINYRTTHEILDWSVRLLAGVAPDGLDDRPDNLRGYRSPMHGQRPVVSTCQDRDTEWWELVERVNSWLDAGVEPTAIGVAARSVQLAHQARSALTAAGIPAGSVSSSDTGGVRVGTMHGMKGLEFRCVAAVGVDDGVVPANRAVTSPDTDPVAHQHDVLRERCLFFVACTRARDSLYVSHVGTPSPFLPS
ncbi:AAA family ATPase [Micromonospora sp. AMSO12t]|uniref:UvrD-helicase domain-containing protein n=1 Tax=Micromonospora sp. AMSO12t TaxID=2650410 RepID=UPI00124AE57C|nr:UvrD-helicase domain-containing protein [Micromonospora sp. AMSO12t]KAB1160099.1 AAA family ATPase [Micromonospora sp. AMSO12t]